MKRGIGNRTFPISTTTTEPFNVTYFQYYFVNTYLALFQVLGIDAQDKMPIGIMMMAMRIQKPETNIEYDFASYLEKER